MEGHKVTVQFLQDLIFQTEPDVTVLSFKVSAGAGRGDNYTSMLFRVSVTGTKAGTEWQRSLIIKRLPDSHARRELYRSEQLFQNEVSFYNQAMSSLLEFQESTGVSNPFVAVPRCFLAQQDVVVLEDLKMRGFVMEDRKQSLDYSHCAAVFREIARFHALSLAMKCRDPQNFHSQVASKVQETFFTEQNEEYYHDYYQTLARNALAMVNNGLEESEKPTYLRKFEEFLDEKRFFKMMVKLAKPQEPLAVLAHGDFWINNVMFRYSHCGQIEEVYLLDFQCSRYCTPVLDLYNFLFACSTRELRLAHMQDLIAEYCTTMSESLASMGCGEGTLPYCKAENLPQMIQEEFRNYVQLGLGLALDMIPICTCDPALAPDLYETDSKAAEHEAVTPFSSESNPECQRRMTELVQDLVDQGYL